MNKNKYCLSFSLLGVLLSAPSCSQEEISRGGDSPMKGRIEFRASLPEVTTRATEITSSGLDDIQVCSFSIAETSVTPYFIDKLFSKSITGKFISEDPGCIWPNNNDLLRFVAFAPSCEDMRQAGNFSESDFVLTPLEENEVMPSFDYKLTGFKVASDIASQSDFVTAVASGRLIDDEGNDINLDFKHQLSRIYLYAWGASKNFNVEIAGVRIGGVCTQGDFNFATQVNSGEYEESENTAPVCWESVSDGSVEYIFREGDELVTLDKSEDSPLTADRKVSILGNKVIDGERSYENSAMLIPAEYQAWQHKDNADNGVNNAEGMYFSVLMRIIDTTPYNPGDLAYPYADNSEGMEVVYLALDEETEKTVLTRLYKVGEKYFTDSVDLSTEYNPDDNGAVVKAFGWAALPVSGNWKPGYEYRYTLNYTNGVGLRIPTDPKPGEPIINDKVLINVEVTEWKQGDSTEVDVPRR